MSIEPQAAARFVRAAAAALRALGASLGRRKLAADPDRAPADAGPAGAAAEWSLWATRNGRPGRF
ncbi:hypothetical protein [Hansschlegelia beijingensis]|uniref:Uncharacterized protein n=1 Tax=Hansschlegelia beijingensis TaxID=1133344 RepID=A0A7W6D5T8_9HYPH|nr:hypothetical protein [Hansschlegelia beijingensis]MBB3974667.1 hypothetical protein [Hansschlegelia beijingensis]